MNPRRRQRLRSQRKACGVRFVVTVPDSWGMSCWFSVRPRPSLTNAQDIVQERRARREESAWLRQRARAAALEASLAGRLNRAGLGWTVLTVEVAEVDVIDKDGLDAAKRFISKTANRYRPPSRHR